MPPSPCTSPGSRSVLDTSSASPERSATRWPNSATARPSSAATASCGRAWPARPRWSPSRSMAAAEAQERDFYRAGRRAFLGDGAPYNWGIQRAYFPDFEPVNDFLHVLCYLYLAAWGVGADEAQRWSIYVGWLRACWQGRAR